MMWAAANDGSAISRRRRHHDKRRRIDRTGGSGGDGRGGEAPSNDDESGSDTDNSDISSDGERSTTESVHDSPSPGAPSSAPSARGDAPAPAAAAAPSGKHNNRKRKKRKRRRKRKIREETPEATMARLKSSYSAAMAAVGALHRLSGKYYVVWKEEGKKNRAANDGAGEAEKANGIGNPGNDVNVENAVIEKGEDGAKGDEKAAESSATNPPAEQKEHGETNGDNTTAKGKLQKAHSVIQRVAKAARAALEQSLLLDHIILAPVFLPDKKNKKGKKGDEPNDVTRRNDSVEIMRSAWLDAYNCSCRSGADAVENGQDASASNAVQRASMLKWNRLSAAHCMVIKQISYLALVNYADLLLCCCIRRRSEFAPDGRNGDILDRGAVPNLEVLEIFSSLDVSAPGHQMIEGTNDGSASIGHPPPSQNDDVNALSSNGLWPNESVERTVRLALAAYCDASELDPTDPILWFKLACAARALGRIMDGSSSSGSPPRSFRCLERLALERGTSSLPRGVPPNRLLTRAQRDMERWDRRPTAPYVQNVDGFVSGVEDGRPIELVLHLPRHSWAMLGRILMRACQEGASYGRSLPEGALHHVWSTNCCSPGDYEFGSPLVDVRISPLLATPSCVIGQICEFLEESIDMKRLRCVCRAMPSELASARAKITEAKKRSSIASETGRYVIDLDDSTGKDTIEEAAIEGPGGHIPAGCDVVTTSASKAGDNQSEADFISPPRRGRMSKRVRSQMISSGKQAERKSKRSSIEYCLLAGTLSCTAQNPRYAKLLTTDIQWERLALVKQCMKKLPAVSRTFVERPGSHVTEPFRADENSQSSRQMDEARAFIAPTSLNAFVGRWSRHNSGPRHFLEEFLIHVSLNPGDVFAIEVIDSMSSCVIDCFDMVVASAERHWYGPETFEDNGNLELSVKALAVNLLNAELRFKRCESHDGSRENQEDSDALAFIVPNLLQFVSKMLYLGVSNKKEPTFFPLRCRAYCLTSSYYLWIGRCSNDASISNDAENFGLKHLEIAMTLLSERPQNVEGSIKTPHLESLGRRGDHWSAISAESLSKHRDHLQSSSILSRARDAFQEIQSRVQGRPESEGDDIDIIAANDKAKLASLVVELLERYNVFARDEKSCAVFEELLSDFLLLHEDHLHVPDANTPFSPEIASNWKGELHWGRIWLEIPSSNAASILILSREGSRPSIMKVLASILASEDIDAGSVETATEKRKGRSAATASSQSEKTETWRKIAGAKLFLIFSKMVQLGLGRAQRFHADDFEDQKLGSGDDKIARQLKQDQLMLLVVCFFTDKMTDIIASNKESEMSDDIESFIEGEEFRSIIFSSLNRSPSRQKGGMDATTLELHLFQSFSRLLFALRESQGFPRKARDEVESVYFVALVKSMIVQTREVADLISRAHDKRLKKWQCHLYRKTDFIFSLANDIAELLSLNPSSLNADGSVNVSHLIDAITDPDRNGSNSSQHTQLAQLSNALLWFQKALNNNTFDDVVRNKLMIPISAALIALCGSPGISISDAVEKWTVNYSDYFDSEDSANGLFLPDSAEDEDQHRRRTLLRKFCQLVQCISLVFRSVDEKMICQESTSLFPSSRHGHFLPLVSVRVLHAMSDGIFQLFGESIWSESYPYGARNCGKTIDSILGKAYLHLYGFSFSGAEDRTKNHAPESINAANQLFRCIKRVYHDNRRSAPSTAFETVELALPPAKESTMRKAVRAFLFSAEKNDEVTNSASDTPRGFPEMEWVFLQNTSLHEDQGDIERLRRGICTSLAKGPITNLDSTRSPSDMDDKGLSEERESAQRHEIGLDQKFNAILECLCYEPRNIENWIVLSECCGFKADYICDRLVPIKEQYSSNDFCLKPESKRQSPSTMSLDELRKSQYEDFQESRRNWTPFLGNNLYVYMKYSWSSFSSLRALANDIGSTFDRLQESPSDTTADDENLDYLCWKEIESKYREGNYVDWANSWAGLFVSALRTMRARALLVARYLAKKSQGGNSSSIMHPSEVSEDIGTALYGHLMASTVYGYPMHIMTAHERRKIAECSLSALQEAIQLSTSSGYAQKSQTICWEIQFMTGKCYEKIASTVKEEMYLSCGEGAHPSRLYERVMTDAIRNYSEAYVGAKNHEQSSGGPDKTCIGGSSHGALECLYRLHASRFKVFISAIRRSREECEFSELEAIRIASVAWFDESNQSSSDGGVRGETWDIFADCVDALTHCRRVIPLFHRAAYRLAQAYSWAPAFHNPDCNLMLGSKQAVPVTKSYRIRGLDTGSCAESAAVIMTSLFEKKRSQLCAVWVTTSARPPPFEVLNDSLRKYDALRLKYISAFIDCMLVCGRKGKIETLLNSAITSNHDLPGFYEASASICGGDPGKHSKLSLLAGSGKGFIAKVKCTAINALAEIMLRDFVDLKKNGVDSEGRVKLMHHFKSAYKLFNRLNSPCKEVVKFITSNKPLAIVEVFCKCYLSVQAGYRISSCHFGGMDSVSLCSILEGAISKAKYLSKKEKIKITE